MSHPPTRPPRTGGTGDSRSKAEAAFKAVTTPKPAEPAPAAATPRTMSLPSAREVVSLRIDREVLEHFQADGPGWQERINAALRKLVKAD